MEKRSFFIIAILLVLSASVYAADDAYEIKVKIKNYKGDVCYLGYPYGDKKYLADTAQKNDQGVFVFSGSKPLDGGLYFIYAAPPASLYFDIVVAEPTFTLETDTLDIVGNMKSSGSLENELFFGFQRFMRDKQKQATDLSEKLKNTTDQAEKDKITAQLSSLDTEVKTYRDELIQKNPKAFAAKFIKSTIAVEVPVSPKGADGKDIDPNFGYKYYKEHYFDYMDFSDPKMLRTPNFYQKVDEYLEKMTVKHPDSIISSAHIIIEKSRADKEVFRYCVVNITYKYETSNIMGMDAVFVDLAENYYMAGDAFWADSALIAKITDRVDRLKPNLIGKPAPKLILLDTLMRPVNLANIKAPYTVIYFYDPDCGHCKKKTPVLRDLYEQKLKSMGVAVIAANIKKEVDEWKKYIRDQKLSFINLADPELHSNFRYEYNIETTPQLYILDEKKTIIAKRLDVEQIEDFINKQIELKTNP
ncbi:MAG: DUF5106 domain-containing protein [Cyclobacteriaceae bacterium]|nr:DUF5106 domain-containing protein [Cyclobacteriaceae bacterium]